MHRILRLVLFALVTTACTGTAGEPTATTTQAIATTIAPTITEAPTTTAAPTTSTTAAADAAPAELEGAWRTDRDDRLRLTLSGTSYALSSSLGGSNGDISVVGDQITFFNCDCPDPACVDPGTYHWVIEGDSLTLSPADPVDPCSGRRTRLAGVSYLR